MILHGYYRSTATYRVRAALGLKGLGYENAFVHLRERAQLSPAFLAINPQGFVPALDVGGRALTQSLAICEYLEEICPHPPLLPADPLDRAQVRAAAQVIACDTHPVQNLRVLDRLRAGGYDDAAVNAWARATIEQGLTAFAALLPAAATPFCFGDAPGLADICLVPQLVNARRFGAVVDLPRLAEIEAHCLAIPAFRRAAPEHQPDAE